jgi:hypothetical protein
MAYWCGILENELTFQAYKYALKIGLSKKTRVDWGYDGFTLPPLNAEIDFDYHLRNLNEFVKQKTGFRQVFFIRKEFDPNEILYECLEKRKHFKALETIKTIDGIPETQTFEYIAQEFEKQHCKIINKAIFMKTTEDKSIPLSEQQIKTSYKHMTYQKLKNGEIVSENFINDWLTNNPTQLCYEDMGVFPHDIPCPPKMFNLWKPFAMEQITTYEPKPEALEIFKNHIRILCGNDDAVTEYFCKWIGQMIQFPSVKSICPILISKEGAGKGTLLDLLRKMLGSAKVF